MVFGRLLKVIFSVGFLQTLVELTGCGILRVVEVKGKKQLSEEVFIRGGLF